MRDGIQVAVRLRCERSRPRKVADVVPIGRARQDRSVAVSVIFHTGVHGTRVAATTPLVFDAGA